MKKFIYIWIIILFFVIQKATSQNYINNYYTFNYAVSTYNGLIYENDSLILSGIVTEWTNQYIGKGFYAKIDLSGEVLQFQKLNTANNTLYRPYLHTFSKAQNGNYLDCGISDDSPKWRYSFLSKLNHNLDTLWFREFTHGDTLTQLVAKGNIELSNKDCLLICEIWYLDANHYGKGNDILVIQTDSMGNEKKRTVYGYPLGTGAVGGQGQWFESVHEICQAPWGYLLGGSGGKNPITGKGGSFIIKLDSAGNKIADYFTNFSDSVYARSYALASNNRIGVAGGQGGLYHPINGSCIDSRAYIGIFDANFQNIHKLLLPESYCYAEFWKMISTHDNGFVACGMDDNKQGWIVKVSDSGQLEWSRKHRIFNNANYQYSHVFYDIVELPDKGFVAAGTAYDYIHAYSPIITNAWLIRTDSFGCLVPGCELVGIAPNSSLAHSFKLYPNPAAERLFLYYNNPELQNCVFTIIDLAGREVVPATHLENSTTYEIPLSHWAQGIYFVQLQDEKGNVYTEKFLKE